MNRNEATKKMESLDQAQIESMACFYRAKAKLAQSEEIVRGRRRRLMEADLDLYGARREFADFCQGINSGPCGPRGTHG